jgi:hypothetical protein
VPSIAPLWEFIYPTGADALGGIQVLYVIVPWVGVMAAGYGFGLIAAMDQDARRRWCVRIGLGAVALFLTIAIPVAVSQRASPDGPPFLFGILAQNKYPASQLFLLMTLGPAIALLPPADRARGWLARVFETFGRVPMFYYLLHIPAIHVATTCDGVAARRRRPPRVVPIRAVRAGAAGGPMEPRRALSRVRDCGCRAVLSVRVVRTAQNPNPAIAVAELHLIAR